MTQAAANLDKRHNSGTHVSEQTMETLYFIARASGRRFSDLVDSTLLRNGKNLDDLSPIMRERYLISRVAIGGLAVRPVTLEEANTFIELNHRHHPRVVGHKFSIGITDEDGLRGVAVAGRPVARNFDDGFTLEITRLCTDGVNNGPSLLLGAVRKAANAMGYRRLITYTLQEEGGVSLRAAGWNPLGQRGGGSWDRPSRPRTDKHPVSPKLLWEANLD